MAPIDVGLHHRPAGEAEPLALAGKLKLKEMVSAEYPLTQINEAFVAMLTGEVARGVVVF